jgi:hypothetical protein
MDYSQKDVDEDILNSQSDESQKDEKDYEEKKNDCFSLLEGANMDDINLETDHSDLDEDAQEVGTQGLSPTKRRRGTTQEEEIDNIFQRIFSTSTVNLRTSLLEYLITLGISSKAFNNLSPIWKIVQNCRSKYATHIHADQEDSNMKLSKLTWYGLPYRDELTKTKANGGMRHYRSKVEMMSKFCGKECRKKNA